MPSGKLMILMQFLSAFTLFKCRCFFCNYQVFFVVGEMGLKKSSTVLEFDAPVRCTIQSLSRRILTLLPHGKLLDSNRQETIVKLR